jgi:hypothetical protein
MVGKRKKNNEIKSSYELQREENIKRNEMFLLSLGINENIIPKVKKSPTKRVKSEKNVIDLVPERRSNRHITADENSFVQLGDNGDIVESKIGLKKQKKTYDRYDVVVNIDNDDDDAERIKITNQSLRDFIDENNTVHSSDISDEQLAHCVMRIRSMTTKALGNRVKAIARARGNSHYEKLLVFYYGLKASGLNSLAESCKNVLNI